MKLPRSDDRTITEISRQVELADRMNYKRDRDLEIGQNRVILTSPNGSRYAIMVSDLGVLSAVAV
jgi:hypothetical protein